MTTKTERISARVDEQVFETLTHAAGLVGSTVNQFLVQAALERAITVIEEQEILRLSNEDSEKFFNAIECPPVPNEKLLAAFRTHENNL